MATSIRHRRNRFVAPSWLFKHKSVRQGSSQGCLKTNDADVANSDLLVVGNFLCGSADFVVLPSDDLYARDEFDNAFVPTSMIPAKRVRARNHTPRLHVKRSGSNLENLPMMVCRKNSRNLQTLLPSSLDDFMRLSRIHCCCDPVVVHQPVSQQSPN